MRDEELQAVAKYLKSMSHPIRLKIIRLLLDGERTVGDLLERIGTTGANLSQHLQILRDLGIVVSERKANVIYNHIADKRFIDLIRHILRLFCPDDK